MKNKFLLDEQFEIKVEFERGQGDPSRVFRAMTGLIESIQTFDQHIAATISTKIQTKLVLQEVKSGSLISGLKTVIKEIPDDVLKTGEAKKVFGHFLCKSKHVFLDWCSKRKEIKSRDDVKELEGELLKLAEQTSIKQMPVYVPIETVALLSDISSVNNALINLDENDSAVLISKETSSQFNKHLEISEDVIRELMTKEAIVSEGERIFKVKKPDYLGKSQWAFKYSNHTIFAKILDEPWLHDFQSSVIKVHPGDSLRAKVKEETLYGYNNEIVQINYEIIEVTETIPAPKFIQRDLF